MEALTNADVCRECFVLGAHDCLAEQLANLRIAHELFQVYLEETPENRLLADFVRESARLIAHYEQKVLRRLKENV